MSLDLKLFQENSNKIKITRFLFFCWLLTLPFGSNLMKLSLGYFTIYPNLVFSLILLPIGLSSLKKWRKLNYVFTGFLACWFIVEIVLGNQINFPKEAIFDLRSLLMQTIFSVILIGVYAVIGISEFRKNLIIGLRCFLFILVVSGVLEFLTGIHFSGTKTAEMLSLPVGNTFYAPMFIYDNQNDYLTYFLFVFFLLCLFDEKLRNNSWLRLSFACLGFLFSIYADSTFAKWICEALIIFSIAEIVFQKRKSISLRTLSPYLIVGAFLILTILNNPLFLGPKLKNGANYRLNAISVVENKGEKLMVKPAKEALSDKQQAQVISYLDSVNTKSPTGATNLRKNLILNGIDFIKEKPFLGLGPGGYSLKCKEKEVRHFVHSHTSAHNFPIELISEFGVFGWLYFVFLLFILVQLFKKREVIDFRLRNSILYFVIALPLLWMMPSAFLYLNIHWLFLPLLIILNESIQDNLNPDGVKQ